MELTEELTEEGYEDSLIIIVTDWLMPGMKGDELLIKIHQQHPKVIKLMLTGQADKDAIERAVSQANLHKCISKPWNENELIDCIRSATA